MKLTKHKYCSLIEDFFSSSAVAGFTNSNLAGNLPGDWETLISRPPGFKYRGLAYLDQIHSSKIIFDAGEGIFSGDGLFTKEIGLALIVKTADCLPLLFASEKLGVVGVVHMGWRSAREGILDNVTYDLKSFKVAAGIGLRLCCYEVGEEFLNYAPFQGFIKKQSVGAHGRAPLIYFDPVSFAKDNLCRRGLKESNFFDLGLCNFCSADVFFSFRRDQTNSRTLSFILKI